MKYFKIIFLLLLFIFSIIICKGQDNNLSIDSIKTNLNNELNKRNLALKNNDLKKIYYYSHSSETDKQTFDEFKKESEEYLEEAQDDSLTIQSFEILKIGKIINCNSEFQSIIQLRTNMLMGKEGFSFDKKLIAFSKDGKKWVFINVGENDIKTIKKLYPFVFINDEND